ncbi:alpha-2-antiplasmin [Erpetoichthys calabaricus]|uniref:alpha-2-antiplasmin n=1 Tax=Erpetoichthys calabaricus TaxID=27687 RepID=UPI002233FA82|nr:alpha-2-antiplasmin [Erpetoichthys calabaricus]
MRAHLLTLLLLCFSRQSISSLTTVPNIIAVDNEEEPPPPPPPPPPGLSSTADPWEYFYTTSPTTTVSTTTMSEPPPETDISVISDASKNMTGPHSDEVVENPGIGPCDCSGGSSEENEDGSRCDKKPFSTYLGEAIMKLGLEMLQQLKPTDKHPNVILSPLSMALGLSQLALGAENETEAMLIRSLHVQHLPCYQDLFRRVQTHLTQTTLHVASRIYLQKEFQVKQKFLEDSKKVYNSEPLLLESLEEVNKWVEAATKGKIKDFLSALPGEIAMMLINVVHFQGLWKNRFDPRFTTKEPFYVDGQHSSLVDMMQAPKYPLQYYEDGHLDAQVASFPFKEGMSLMVVLPHNGQVNVSALAQQLSPKYFYSKLSKVRNLKVKIPKLNLEYSQEMTEVLAAMGLEDLFKKPQLGKIASGHLFVSSVQHKTTLEMNEEGAEASAATSIAISRSLYHFSVNQPFLFALLDDASYVPIFMGVVTNPNPNAKLNKRGDDETEKFAPTFNKSMPSKMVPK